MEEKKKEGVLQGKGSQGRKIVLPTLSALATPDEAVTRSAKAELPVTYEQDEGGFRETVFGAVLS